jgi:hypothetical protein
MTFDAALVHMSYGKKCKLPDSSYYCILKRNPMFTNPDFIEGGFLTKIYSDNREEDMIPTEEELKDTRWIIVL